MMDNIIQSVTEKLSSLPYIETSAIKGHGRVMGTGTLVHSLGSMNLSPMILLTPLNIT